jgi:hypothetical protein
MTNISSPVEVTYDKDLKSFVVNVENIEVARLSLGFLTDAGQSVEEPDNYSQSVLKPLFTAAYRNVDVTALHEKSLEPIDKLNRLLIEGQSGTEELRQQSREAHIEFKAGLNEINASIYNRLLKPEPVSEPELVV